MRNVTDRHYRPGMKGPEMLQAGTDYLNKKKGSK